jgi:Ca2+-binding EF-hand superfamily protein
MRDLTHLTHSISPAQIELSKSDVSRIFLKYSLEADGKTLSYTEFMRLVNFSAGRSTASSSSSSAAGGGRGGSALREEVDALVDRIRRKLEDSLGSSAAAGRRIKETFEDIDSDDSGGLSRREMSKAFDVLKLDVTSREMDALFERFGEDKSGELPYSAFLKLISADHERERERERY